MSTEEKNAEEKTNTPSNQISCREMMQKMTGECSCAGMMEQMRPTARTRREEAPDAESTQKV